jgi:hypothetical protein
MAKRKNDKPRQSQPKKTKEVQAIYDRVRREFTAADLQKYTEIEEGIPLGQVIAELEALYRKTKQKRAYQRG